MAKLTLADISTNYLSTVQYNANNALIEAALENTLSRDGTTPNYMDASFDMHDNRIINLADAENNSDAVTYAQLVAAGSTTTYNASVSTYNQGDTNAVDRTVASKLQESISVKDFGAIGDGSTDDTVAIQNAINYASKNDNYTVYIPAGHYKYSKLYTYYDATDNPGYNNTDRHGMIKIKGDGALDISNMRTYDPLFGTILESTETTANSFLVASSAEGHDISPYPARKFTLENITLVGNSTATILEINACPNVVLNNNAILQQGTGNGVDIRSAWFGSLSNTKIINTNASPTGDGLILGTDTNAGLFEIVHNSLIDGFNDGITWESGGWNGLSIRDTAIQSSSRYSINVKGGQINQLNLDNAHFEGDGRTSDLVSVASSIRHLVINNSYFLAGTTLASYLTGAIISLADIETVDIKNNYIFRMWTTFCNITASRNGLEVGQASRNTFNHDNEGAVTGPIYLFTGILPTLEDNTWTGQGTGFQEAETFQMYDFGTVDAVYFRDPQTYTQNIGRIALGPIHIETGQSGTYNTSANGNNGVYDITNTVASSITLSNAATQIDGKIFFIQNNAASVGILNVRNSSDSSIIATLAIDEGGMFVLDKFGTGKYIRIKL